METQEQIDDFILANVHEDPFLQDFLFHKLYNQLGEDDDLLRDILHVTLDFSKKKIIVPL